jgi:hypothetical protein
VRKSRSVELPPYLLLPVSPRGRIERQVPSRTGGARSRLVTPCPIGGKHSCAPLQGMSMLVPDFAAVRYFFNYRFPHVRERCYAGARRGPCVSDTQPVRSGFSGGPADSCAALPVRPLKAGARRAVGLRSAAKKSRPRRHRDRQEVLCGLCDAAIRCSMRASGRTVRRHAAAAPPHKESLPAPQRLTRPARPARPCGR